MALTAIFYTGLNHLVPVNTCTSSPAYMYMYIVGPLYFSVTESTVSLEFLYSFSLSSQLSMFYQRSQLIGHCPYVHNFLPMAYGQSASD